MNCSWSLTPAPSIPFKDAVGPRLATDLDSNNSSRKIKTGFNPNHFPELVDCVAVCATTSKSVEEKQIRKVKLNYFLFLFLVLFSFGRVGLEQFRVILYLGCKYPQSSSDIQSCGFFFLHMHLPFMSNKPCLLKHNRASASASLWLADSLLQHLLWSSVEWQSCQIFLWQIKYQNFCNSKCQQLFIAWFLQR